MVNWDNISIADLKTLAKIADDNDMCISAMIRSMHVLTADKQKIVADILKRGIHDEGTRQHLQQGRIHKQSPDA